MSARVFETPAALLDAVGERLPDSPWMTVDQERIDLFARATDDFQWIHVAPARAAEGPFGATIAHGYLTLSLANRFLPQMMEVRGVSMGVNVGTERARFLAPVKVGSRVRGTGEILSVSAEKGGIQAVVRVTIEIEGSEKPGCVVDTISRFYPETRP
jgi:acyl dehydratase